MCKRWSGLALLVLTVAPGALAAQGWIERSERTVTMHPVPQAVIRVGSSVRVRLDGRVARFEVEEQFRNTGRGIAEGAYLYPLAGEAVFTDFSLFQGDRELKGEVMNADQARQIYEDIVRRQKDPALLSLAGHGLIRARVFPIQPGETRTVILRYSLLLPRAGDVFRLRYALGTRGDNPITIQVSAADARQFGVPFSPTHEVDWRADAGRLTVRSECRPPGDFELLLPIRRGLLGTTVVTHAPGGDDRYAMIVLSPPAVRAETVLPRDLTLVVDVSGSMAGDKMEQARSALRQALGSLRRDDRFRLIAFSSGITEFARGFSPADPATVRRAREFVDGLEARGGTNIAGALERAFDRSRGDTERMGIVLFMTDGLPSVGEQSPERLAAEAAARRGDLRVFPIGVGHDVNTYLLDRLAVEGRGRVEYVPPQADVEQAMGSVLSRIDAPALTNIRIVRSPVRLIESAPADLPDLFFGEELVVFARYRGHGSGQLTIEGMRGNQRQTFSANVRFAEHERDNGYIAPLWASRRIGELTRQLRLEGHSPALVKEIRELALRYGIITEFTSYLVLEPEARLADGRIRQEMVVTGRAAAAPAPAAQSGERAFRGAKQSADLSEAKSLAAANEVAREAEEQLGNRADSKRVGGKLFVQRDNIWTDVAHSDSLQIVDVAPYSPAWFALSRALPEIVPWLAAGDEVLVAGRKASIRISANGVTGWQSGRLEKLVKDFRGQ